MSAVKNRQVPLSTPVQSASSARPRLLRILQGTAVAALVLASVIVLVYSVAGAQWRGRTFAGFNTAYTVVVDGNKSLTGQEWAGIAAGIQRLDRIVQINDVPLPVDDYAAARANIRNETAQMAYGDTLEVTFTRPANGGTVTETGDVTCGPVEGNVATCNVAYTLAPMPDGDFLTFFVFPLVSGVIALMLGWVLLVARFQQPSALVVAVFCAALAVFSAGVFNNATTYFPIPVWSVMSIIGGGATLLLALVFPTQFASVHRFPALLAIPIVATVIVAGFSVFQYYTLADPRNFASAWQTPVLFVIACYITLALSLLFRRHYAVSSIHRDQVNTSIIGVGLAAIPALLWALSTISVLTGSGFAIPFNSATVLPFFTVIPICLAYAVLQYRGFDSERVLGQGITYLIMLAALVLGYGLLVFGINLIALDLIPTELASNPLVVGTVVFVIAVLFLPVRTYLQRQIDQIYYREQRQHQDEIEAFTDRVASTQSFEQILQLYVDRVRTVTDARGLFIFLPDEESGEYLPHRSSEPQTDIQFDADSDLVPLLQRLQEPLMLRRDETWRPELIAEKAKLDILQAHLIIALRGSGERVNGFVVVGPPPTGRLYSYSYENIRFMENLSAQMAISVERAKVVESLERRVSELDVLSQVSQAVNFAVEFDDLLELISAQTQRLVEAPHFYIALRDASANQMYYAFFLEFNERLRDREEGRWTMGSDLYAEILEEGQPRRYSDYNVTVQTQNAARRGIDEEVKAWMGVPLVAGQTRLGVMAVGSSQPAFTYTDNQLKVFTDIGALAATSLDKARLFEETNQRARQLRALNEISRQLQSERDIDKLTDMITKSAVDILEAEAGSLLLTKDDDSSNRKDKLKDLEFRVVIGGGAESLVGTTVEAGHGVVGEVARSATPIIVNDARDDKHWEGELSNDGSFSTDALLAVPLIANNEVIGVLEVLNKKDGSLFVNEDADVLETFAGQAAIAIENTRLFQETDEQLSLRVQELETLDRIDTEMNRALETDRVAEITVKWAVANTGANAALIGLVLEGTPPSLQILANYGYEPEEMPEGTEEGLMPLDKGIAARVLKTKRADTNDVSIDPAYVPGLRGSNSQITVPMLAGGEVIAILVLEKNTQPPLNLVDQRFVQRLTDHAAIALENARLYGELDNANKTQSHFMGVGAHELKNALSPIRGWTDLLRNGVLGDINDQQSNYLSVIKSNADRMQLIIDDLKDFAKMRANELRVVPEPIDFRKVAIETLRTFTAQLEEKEQTLVNNVSEDLPLIMGDHQRLVQVMTNFISNANKYSPNGAVITLDAQVERDRQNDAGRHLGDFMHITVADTGIGMSEEDQREMFTPYFRSENQDAHEQPGTGLGMSLTRELIIQHDGEVWLESELGEGTTFHFTIPLAKEVEEAKEVASEPASD